MEKKIDIDGVLRALGDPSRRKMVEMVTERPRSVSKLAAPLGITLAAVMQHLAILEAAGLVETKKSGRERICTLASDGFAVLQEWLNDRRHIWDKKLDALGGLLEEE